MRLKITNQQQEAIYWVRRCHGGLAAGPPFIARQKKKIHVMTKSYIVDPTTGKLLTVQEWKDKAGNKVEDAKMIAFVPDDGSPAFAMPVEVFPRMDWNKAMDFSKGYKAPHFVEGSDGAFALPSRKQAIDIRAARENGLEQLLEMIGAGKLLLELQERWGWTRERYVPAGSSEEENVRYVSGIAWAYYNIGMSLNDGFGNVLAVRPVTLLNL